MNKNRFNHIEFDILDGDMYRKQFNYYNKLYEKHHIVTDYDTIFDTLVDMAWEYKKCRYITNFEFDEDSTYEKIILTNYMYNPFKKECVDIDENADVVIADEYVNWHPIVIKIIKYNPLQTDYDFNTSAYVFRDVKNKSDVSPLEDIRTSIHCDPITIAVYIDNIDDKFALRRVLRHELLHSKQVYSTNKDISNNRKNQLCRVSPDSDFNFNNDDEYERLFGYVYIFAENEQEAFRNEIYQLVLDMDDEELNRYKDLYHSYHEISFNIIRHYYSLFMINLFDEMEDLYSARNYRYLLLIAYYLHRHNYFKISSKYINKVYLQKLIDEKRQPSDDDFNESLKNYIKDVLYYIINVKNKYIKTLMISIFDAIDKRGLVLKS